MILKTCAGSSHCGSKVTNLTSIPEDAGLIFGFAQWIKDLALLWLWHSPAAVALIQPIAWELPHASGVAIKCKKKRKKKKKNLCKAFFTEPFSLAKGIEVGREEFFHFRPQESRMEAPSAMGINDWLPQAKR